MKDNLNFSAGTWNSIFAVPTCIVDQYLKKANPCAIKVLLYLLRHNMPDINLEQLSKAVNESPEQIEEAIEFWQNSGVFSQIFSAKVPEENSSEQIVAANNTTAQIITPPSAPVSKTKNVSIHSTNKSAMSGEEIAKRKETSKEISFLFNGAEKCFGKMLSPSDQRGLIHLFDWAGLPADVILMVVEYCKSIGKLNMRYIEKVAVSWTESGIATHEDAEKHIIDLKLKKQYESLIKSCFGIYDRSLSTNEKKYITQWKDDFGYDLPVVKLAYDKTIDATGKLSFPYIHSILNSWHANGIATVEQALAQKSSAKQSAAPSFDLKDFESYAMEYIPK